MKRLKKQALFCETFRCLCHSEDFLIKEPEVEIRIERYFVLVSRLGRCVSTGVLQKAKFALHFSFSLTIGENAVFQATLDVSILKFAFDQAL